MQKGGEELGICHDMPVVLRKPRWFPQRNSPSANETPTFASIELEVLRICTGNRWEIAVLYHLCKKEQSAKNDKIPRNMCCTSFHKILLQTIPAHHRNHPPRRLPMASGPCASPGTDSAQPEALRSSAPPYPPGCPAT